MGLSKLPLESPATQWQPGPHDPVLNSHEIHLWHALLPLDKKILDKLKKSLSEEELSRLERFRFNADKERYILSRGGIRDLLSRYLNKAPHEIQFFYSKLGKPYLSSSTNHSTPLQFNISHSGNYVLYAIANNVPVGIDIECFKYEMDFLAVAKEFCTARELAKLSSLPCNEQCLAFYRCWTRKEAFIKAIGQGLYFPTNQVEVNFVPDEKPKFLHIQANSVEPEEAILFRANEKKYWEMESWKIEEITLNQDCVASLVIPKNAQRTALWILENINPL